MKTQFSKFSFIRDLLLQDADKIQKLASQQHKYLLGAKILRNEYLDKYIAAHILIIKALANNLKIENIKRGTPIFKKIGKNLARESLKDGLTLEETVDGTIFLKQAIWQKLKEEGLLNQLNVDDFYEFSFIIGTYCDILVSVIAFVYHTNYIKTLQAQDRHKDEFMSIATHELKTPVTSLKIFAQVLENRFAKAGDETSALHLAKMDAQLNKLTALIEDLLDATKINSGKLQFHEEFFDVNELVSEIVEEMQRTTEKHTLIKKLRISKIIYGDRTRVGQVLTNLISNAIKYSPKSDKIIIMTKIEKGSVTISVQDFGIGIAKEDQPKIFKRFQRVGNQNTFGGLGLGLFIAATIMQRHGGKIWVESEEGKGSTFSFSLPLKREKIKQQKNTIVKGELDHE
ncbi:MAG TPA: HAMP domain-containing sensor histidine kinase [Candidatus Saccharimonadales bacterium]|nr:HAMP domain-containing sensor histidine kinase [Candidatus Saccharimonadales bacterium]